MFKKPTQTGQKSKKLVQMALKSPNIKKATNPEIICGMQTGGLGKMK